MKTIPFNYDLWKAGKGKAVYRDGTEPEFVVRFYRETPNTIHSSFNGLCYAHSADGRGDPYIGTTKDLLLQTQPTYVPLEQKDWILDGPWWVRDLDDKAIIRSVRSLGSNGQVIFGDGYQVPLQALQEHYERTNAERMSDPSIPEDQKWVACRKEAM